LKEKIIKMEWLKYPLIISSIIGLIVGVSYVIRGHATCINIFGVVWDCTLFEASARATLIMIIPLIIHVVKTSGVKMKVKPKKIAFIGKSPGKRKND